MTQKQKERWEAKTLAAIRKHLRESLAILTYRSVEEKREIERRVMADMEKIIRNVSDETAENERSTLSYELEADGLAMDILQEHDKEREMFR